MIAMVVMGRAGLSLDSQTDTAAAIIIAVIEHHVSITVPDDRCVLDHVAVEVPRRNVNACIGIVTYPKQSVERLGVAEAVGRSFVREPHTPKMPIAEHHWS